MSDRPSRQSPGASRKLQPNVSPLESRLLLSRQVSFPDGASVVFPLVPILPRTGGVPLQSGTALTIGVGQPKINTVQATFDGAGGAQVEWNGGPAHSFTGVQATLVQTGRARNNVVVFNLTGPRTIGTSFATGLLAATREVSAKSTNHIAQALRLSTFRTSGVAVQNGSLLVIFVNAPKMNTVELSSLNFGQVVQAEWNGGAVHDFSGVSTIIVDTTNGTNDLVGLDVAAG
ncbi:MAG TPA: hypothetical protein VGZ22_20695 [Isosphaeraceae bacterium]|nr:hypothetical protein [Isosphaeraceae bacterium]